MTAFVVVGVVVVSVVVVASVVVVVSVVVVLVASVVVTVIAAGHNKLTPCALRHSTSFSLQSNLALGIPRTRRIPTTGTSRSRD